MNDGVWFMFVTDLIALSGFIIVVAAGILERRKRRANRNENWSVYTEMRPTEDRILRSLDFNGKARLILLLVFVPLLIFEYLLVDLDIVYVPSKDSGWLVILVPVNLFFAMGIAGSITASEYWLLDQGITDYSPFKGDIFVYWSSVGSVKYIASHSRSGVSNYIQIKSGKTTFTFSKSMIEIQKLVKFIEEKISRDKWVDPTILQKVFDEINGRGKQA